MKVYLDNHATTAVDPRVLDAMLPYFKEVFGNAGSKMHSFGQAAQEAVEISRKHVAEFMGASAKEIVFTSGATEANNIALMGAVHGGPQKKRHIITQASEHHAVLDPLKELTKEGVEITTLTPDSAGRIAPSQVAAAIRDDTLLVSIMAANNEIGTIQDLAGIGEICRDRSVIFHSDAAQAAGKFPLDVNAMNVDLLSISAHKFYGPKGVGALFVRKRGRRVALRPSTFGGGQEGGLRPGTHNVPGIVGLAESSRLVLGELNSEMRQIGKLRDRLLANIRRGFPDVVLHGAADMSQRVAGNLSLGFPGVDGAALIVGLRSHIAASSGSACSTGNRDPSHVLKSIGIPDTLSASTLRLCVGRFNTETEIDFAAEQVATVACGLRQRGAAVR